MIHGFYWPCATGPPALPSKNASGVIYGFRVPCCVSHQLHCPSSSNSPPLTTNHYTIDFLSQTFFLIILFFNTLWNPRIIERNHSFVESRDYYVRYITLCE